MNLFLKMLLFVTMPIWFLPFGVVLFIKLVYEEFDDWIDPKESKDKYKKMTHYDA
jgi:hypothetical protein